MASAENIKVAIRVRPFSEREKRRKAQLIVKMDGQSTYLVNPEKTATKPHIFNFDYSYWSHDGFTADDNGILRPDGASKYIDQFKIFDDLGRVMLDNSWKGYNCSIFAYGQTGSGKSYSIMGHGSNKGLVPRTCEELFVGIEEKSRKGVSYAVTFSMVEIYNEQVRDLLNKKSNPSGGLRVRQRQDKGFYVEGLSVVPVGNYRDILLRMNEGEKQRTIASTKMNEISSRAHTIVTINFSQNDLKAKTSKVAQINLVDLAGSERVSQTEATGDRFEEAKNINKSLMTLGQVIKALCERLNKKPNTHVPYRNSVLTQLLSNTLGGNSKTAMIAAISPDAENYDQTLSTLRYADTAKSITTQARVNTGETNKIIKELIAEKERLLKELQDKKGLVQGYTEEDLARIKEEQELEIRRYKEQMDDMKKGWEKRLEESQHEMNEMAKKQQLQEEQEKKQPHFSNLNSDPGLTGKITHLIRKGKSTIGKGKGDSDPQMKLNGPGVAQDHAVVVNKDGKVSLIAQEGCRILRNGQEVSKPCDLDHNDRILFGTNNLFLFVNPIEAESLKKKGREPRPITFDFAQSEIAKHSGLDVEGDDSVLQEEVLSIMQLVNSINAMAEELERPVHLTTMLVSAEARGLERGRTELYVEIHDQQNNNHYYWNKNTLLNRQVLMQELYQQLEEHGHIPEISQQDDPFWEPSDTAVLVGVSLVPLKYLSYMLDFTDEDPFAVIDYHAKQVGHLKVELVPCDKHGKESTKVCVDDPMELVGKSIAFKINISQGYCLPTQFQKTWCKYKFYQELDYITSDKVSGSNPQYNHERLFKLSSNQVDHKLLDYLSDQSLTIEIWGSQGGPECSPHAPSIPTKGQTMELKKQNTELLNSIEILEEKLHKISNVVRRMPSSPEVKKIKDILAE